MATRDQRGIVAVVAAFAGVAWGGWTAAPEPPPGLTPAAEVSDGGGARRGDCGEDTITQSNNQNLITSGSVWCGTLETSQETSLARAFVAPYDMELKCVTFGIRECSGGDSVANVRVLSGTIDTEYPALTLLTEVQMPVADGTAFQFFTVPVPPVLLPAGSAFIVELNSPSRDPAEGGDGGLLSFGCNGQGQTAPTYFRAPTCDLPNFVDVADVGFGNRRLVMTLGVTAGLRPVVAGGFPLTAVGGATMSILDGDVVLAGGSGLVPSGASIAYGDWTSGAGTGSFRTLGEDTPESSLAIQFRSSQAIDTITFRSDPLDPEVCVLDTDFAPPILPTFDVLVFNDGVLVGILTDQSSGTIRFSAPGGSPRLWKWLKNLLGIKAEVHCETETEYYENGNIKSKTTSYGGSLETAAISGNGGSYEGNEFEIRLRGVPEAGLPPPVQVSLVAVQVPGLVLDTSDNGPSVRFGDAQTQPRDLPAGFETSMGVHAAMMPSAPGLATAPVLAGSDDDGDGVAELALAGDGGALQEGSLRLSLGGVNSMSMDLNVVNPGATGACAKLSAFQRLGGFGGTTLLDPDPKRPPWIFVAGDFGRAGTYRLQVVSNGIVVWDEPGKSGIAGSTSLWPYNVGKLGGSTPCWRWRYPIGTSFVVASSGETFACDEVRLLAEDAPPPELLDTIEVTATSMEALVLFSPVVELPAICPGDINGDGLLNIFDFLFFQTAFGNGDLAADFTGDGQLNVFDFLAFQTAFGNGCP